MAAISEDRKTGRWALPTLMLIALLVVPLALAPCAVAQGGDISGVIIDPEGLAPPAGTVVRLFKADHSTFGQAAVDPDGSFSLAGIPNGNYVLRAIPPEPSPFTPSLPLPVSVLGAPVNVGTVELTDPSMLGTVFAPDGVTPAGASIHIHSAGGANDIKPASGGLIKIGGLPAGSYVLQAWPTVDEPFWASQRLPVTITSGISQTISLTLTAANVYGRAVDPLGQPVKEAVARVLDRHGHVVGRDLTSASGYFAVGGLAPGSYHLALDPPWWQAALVPPMPVPFVTPPHQDLGAIAFRASQKVVMGFVHTNAAQPVANALIAAYRLDKAGRLEALSGAGGRYTINLSEGLWSLTVRPISTTAPANWLYPNGPQLVHFAHDTSNEEKTVDFKVITADSSVSGTVDMPDGSVPPFTVTVGIHTDAGIGRSQEIDPDDGTFDIPVPHGGYKVSVLAHDPGFLGPSTAPIRVLPNSVYDLGTLSLLERNAIISGTVSGPDGPVEEVPMVAWRQHTPGAAETNSGPEGGYILSVVEGTWLVKPAPGPDRPWLYAGPPAEVEVSDGGIVGGIDFDLIATDAEIHGVLVDEQGAPLVDARGWANAVNKEDPSVQKGAPASDGTFRILVPAGPYRVSLKLPEGAPWLAGPAQDIEASSGLTSEVTLTLRTKDAVIVGALWDPRAEVVVGGVKAQVMAFGEGAWVRTEVKPGNGSYRLDVAPGIWSLGYRLEPDSDYVALRRHRNVPVTSGQTVPAPLPVAEKDGQIAGIVLDPLGAPLAGASVVADGRDARLGDLHLSTTSGDDGRFRLAVPHGHYSLRAAGEPNQSWIHPLSKDVRVPPGGSVTGLRLQFLAPDATISGTVTLEGGGVHSGTVKLWGYSMDDGYAHTRTGVGQGYELDVISDTVWFVGGAYQDGNSYWVARSRVEVPVGGATLDLELHGPHPLPAPLMVSFDASQEQYLEMADGTSIFVPAGAMPVSGTVTLQVTPIATFPHQRHANIYRYGYAFTASDGNGQPIEQRFNQDVLITFSYDQAALVQMGISEAWLKPAYFATTTDSWTFPESYVVDTVNDVVAMQIDHFTDFALTGAAGYRLFLPIVLRVTP